MCVKLEPNQAVVSSVAPLPYVLLKCSLRPVAHSTPLKPSMNIFSLWIHRAVYDPIRFAHILPRSRPVSTHKGSSWSVLMRMTFSSKGCFSLFYSFLLQINRNQDDVILFTIMYICWRIGIRGMRVVKIPNSWSPDIFLH